MVVSPEKIVEKGFGFRKKICNNEWKNVGR
jgi:hypothetical protein